MAPTFWTPYLGWMAAGTAALALAFVAPTDHTILGRVPQIAAKRLDERPIALPQDLPAQRTLAIVVFRSSQHDEVRSWVDGMQLKRDASIAWIKMPVLDDKGDEKGRREFVRRLAERYAQASQHERAALVPVVTDRDGFIRATRLSGADHASVLVLDRDGTVLAKAEGGFSEEKAQMLRATLLAQNDRQLF